MSDMPQDPFIPDDLSQFGQGAYNFYASLKNAGFTEEQALDLTKTIVINMLMNALKVAS
jgi:hypothetical protein